MPLRHAGAVITPEDLNGLDWIELMRDCGLNTLGLHSGGGKGVGVLQKLEPALSGEFRARAREAGIELEYELHAASDLLPRSLFAERPELFAFDFRKACRTPDSNFCPSSDEALAIVAGNASKLAEALNPTTGRFFFWSDDGCPWCHCDRCSGLTDSDQELLMANAIARAVRLSRPGARVAHLAYNRSLPPPKTVRPEAGVFLEFAPIRRCFRHAIDDAGCAVNVHQWESLRQLLEVFRAEDAHVLEYWLDSSLASNWKRPAQKAWYVEDVVARDIEAYCRVGIRSITTFAVYIDGQYVGQFGDGEVRGYEKILSRFSRSEA